MERVIRLVHLLGTARHGGVETFVLNLAKTLDRTRFQLEVCILDDDGPIAHELGALHVPVTLLGRKSKTRAWLRLYQRLVTTKCDILHANVGGRSLRYVARAARVPKVIVHLHGPPRDVAWNDARAPLYLRRAVAAADKVLVSSDAMRRHVERAAPEVAALVERVYYGVDRNAFEESGQPRVALREYLGLQPDHVVVGFVGRLVPQKGIADLAEIARNVLREQERADFIIVGDGPLKHLLNSVQQDFPGRVHLLGARSDVPSLMRSFDVLVVPSAWEPLGIVSIEAMLAGKPVAAFDVDGISEVVVHRQTGLLAAAGDAQGCTQHVLRLVKDAALRETLGNAGRLRARTRFDARVMTTALERIYERL